MASTPGLILVMRHAEKPDDPKDPDLSQAGFKRADELSTYLPQTFGKPDNLFAAAITKHSARPYETIEPLSKRIGVPIDATIADADYEVLATDLLNSGTYANRRVVVCWHHGNIPSLMHALGATSGEYPASWNPAVFNLILKIEFTRSGSLVVTQVSEPF
jgi:phosphohistidine phosphatase SixA